MVKAHSSHKLQQKFKPWRKGKSNNAKKGTLKSQLRGQERLLAKTDDPDRKNGIQQKIQELKGLIDDKNQRDRIKENAQKSHGARFLDRQRLTRLWRKAHKQPSEGSSAQTKEDLLRIAIDMAYCAHFPHQYKYMTLFKNGQTRIQDNRKNLKKRAKIRNEILSQQPLEPRVSWMDDQLYKMLPTSWSVSDEETIFGVLDVTESNKEAIQDERFARVQTGAAHDALLQAAREVEQKVDQEILQEQSRKSSDSGKGHDHDDDDSNGSTSSSDGEISVGHDDRSTASSNSNGRADRKIPLSKNAAMEDSDDDSSTSSSDSDQGDHKKSLPEKQKTLSRQPLPPPPDEDEDDFLVAVNDNIDERAVFKQAKQHLPSIDHFKGDKSKGWDTQRQRPGEFKRKKHRY